MNERKSSTRIAGVDVSKRKLDVAIHATQAMISVANTCEGHGELLAWLAAHRVGRVGLEATGGYERALILSLQAAGVEVVLHQPIEVRLFARIRRRRAKNDRIDARLIACATAQVDTVRATADPRLAELAERMTAYEQAADMAAVLKTQIEHIHLPDLIEDARAQLAQLMARKARLAADLLRRVRLWPDLARRFDLVRSLPGVGPVVALGLIVRMPELGAMNRGQAAALIGVAPFDRDSGACKGQRFIAGGRRRPRRLLYIAAMAAKRCDPGFRAFADRLATNAKQPRKILVAIMRKLIEAANLILKRDRPWEPTLN